MSDPISDAIAYLDRRLATMERSPGTWGSPESLELQALLLLELRTLLLRRRTYAKNPFEVRNAHIRFVHARFSDRPGYLLSALLPPESVETELPPLLGELRRQIVERLGAEDPFTTNDLVIDLVLGGRGRGARFAAACRYFCRFERALRALVGTSTSKRKIARVALPAPEVRVLSEDGDAARVLLLVNGLDGRQNAQAVGEAVGALLDVLAWLEGKAERPDAAENASAVTAARRLLPRRGIRSVRIGGTKAGRGPLEIEANDVRRADASPAWAAPSTMLPRLPPRFSAPEAPR